MEFEINVEPRYCVVYASGADYLLACTVGVHVFGGAAGRMFLRDGGRVVQC